MYEGMITIKIVIRESNYSPNLSISSRFVCEKCPTASEAITGITSKLEARGIKLFWTTRSLMEGILMILARRGKPMRRLVLIDALQVSRVPHPHDLNGTLKRVIPILVAVGLIEKRKVGRSVYYGLKLRLKIDKDDVKHQEAGQRLLKLHVYRQIKMYEETLFIVHAQLTIIENELELASSILPRRKHNVEAN